MKIHIRARYVRCGCGGKFIKVFKDRYVCDNCDNENPSHYFLEFYWAGKQVQIYSDEKGRPLDSLARAKLLQEDIIYEIRHGSFSPKKYSKAKTIKAGVLLDQFLKEKLKELAPSYRQNYKSLHKIAKAFFPSKNIREIRKVDLINYQSHIQNLKPDIGPSTIYNYLAWFRVFLNWSKDRELLTLVPSLPKIDVPEPIMKWLNKEDQMKVLEAASPEDMEILRFAMLQGTRPGETRALKVKDVDLNNKVVHIFSTFSNNIYRLRIPTHSGRAFRLIPATHSGAFRPPPRGV